MARTRLQLANVAKHSVGGALDSRLDVNEVVNQAGRFLCNMRPWEWRRKRQFLTIPAEASSPNDTIALPSDFLRLNSITAAVSLTGGFFLTTLEDIIWKRRRAITTAPTLTFWGAIDQPDQTSSIAAMGPAQLEIWPTRQSGELALSNALRLDYHARWTELDDDTDLANCPLSIEPLLEECVRAFAQGLEDGDLEARKAAVMAGAGFLGAAAQDAGVRGVAA